VPYNFGFCLPTREGSGVATYPIALNPASLLGRALALPCAPRLWTMSPCLGGLRCCHVSHGFRPHLTAWEGLDAATSPVAPNTTSLLWRALALPRASQLWTPPPCSRGLRRCHVSRGSGPHLPAHDGSDAVTCPVALNPASLVERALVLSCASRLPSREGSSINTCPVAPVPAFQPGALQRCHTSYSPLWAMDLKHKEKPSRAV
jgi:hypothetical protein